MLGLGNNIFKSSTAEGSLVSNRVSFIGLLNETYGADAEAAYSVRKLSSSATVAMTIRRESDDEELAIGFVDGNINEAAIEAHCTGTTCKVVQWNDQSGNNNHATQDSEGSQPTIYTGGALVKDGGRVALTSSGNTSFDFTQITDINSVFSVLRPTNFTDNSGSFILGDTSSYHYHSGEAGKWLHDNYTNPAVRNGSNYLNGSSVNLKTTVRSAGQYVLSMIHAANTAVASQISYDRNIADRSWIGNRQEIIIYSDARTNQRTDIEENIGDYFTQNTPLLDTYSGAAAAYSLRKLKSDYTGPAISVRNASNVDLDIGFNVFGELDTLSLLAHTGSGDGFVGQWYDQSGSGNHASQTSEGSQPQIVSSGAVITENGKPAVEFNGSDYFSFNSRIYAARTMIAVLNLNPFQYNRLCSNSVEIQNSSKGWVNGSGNSETNEKFNINAVSINGVVDSTSPYGSNLIGLYNLSYFTGNGVDSDGLGEIGWHNSNRSILGRLQELILYPNEDTDNRTNIETNINTFYNIYS